MFEVGTDKSFLFKEENTWSAVPDKYNASKLRRVNASFDVVTEVYPSNEICMSFPSGATDNTSMLLHLDSLPILDSVGNDVIQSGALSVVESRFNRGLRTEDELSYLKIDLNKPFTSNNFTIECFVSCEQKRGCIFSIGSYGVSSGYSLFSISDNNNIILRLLELPEANSIRDFVIPRSLVEYPNNIHLAFVGVEGLLTLYINGVNSGTVVSSANVTNIARIMIGNLNSYGSPDFVTVSPSYQFLGVIDEFRISDGAVYLNNFTPPTSPFALQSASSVGNKQVTQIVHGLINVKGVIKSELSPGTYSKLLSNVLSSNYFHSLDINDLSIKIIKTANSNETFDITRESGSWVIDGITSGLVIRLDGSLLDSDNKQNNLYVCGANDQCLTVYPLNGDLLFEHMTFISPIRCYTVGAISYASKTNKQDKSFTFEECSTKLNQYELYSGNKVKSFEVAVDSKSGFPIVNFELLGRDLVRKEQTQYFNDVPYTSTQIVNPVCTKIFVDGNMVGSVSALTIRAERNLQLNHIVGDKSTVDISENMLKVSGSFTIYFKDSSIRSKYYGEKECSISVVFADSLAKSAQTISFCLPRVKMKSLSKIDNSSMLYDSFEFNALLNSNDQSYLQTTVSIQDSTVNVE